VLDVPHVAPDACFRDLGGDAERAAVLIGQVRDVFGVALSPDALDGNTATPAHMARDVEASRRS
jgi:hypothetical protein